MSWVRAVSTLSNWVCIISFMPLFFVLLECVVRNTRVWDVTI